MIGLALRCPAVRETPFGSDEDRSAPGRASGHDIHPRIADEPGGRRIDLEGRRCPPNQPRLRLSAVALDGVLVDPVRVVRTRIEAGPAGAEPPDLALEVVGESVEAVEREIAARDARLVRDDRNSPAVLAPQGDGVAGGGCEPDASRIDVVGQVLDQGSVLVEECDRAIVDRGPHRAPASIAGLAAGLVPPRDVSTAAVPAVRTLERRSRRRFRASPISS